MNLKVSNIYNKLENYVINWKEWLDDFEKNEFVPFKNHILPTFEFIDETITESDYIDLINQINQPPIKENNVKHNTQISSSNWENDILFTR